MKIRPEIQGLRAIAVLLVIAHHYFPHNFTGGFLGVDIFFVISGYVITKSLLTSKKENIASFLSEFYARRVRRILPSALLVICVSTFATWYLLGSITGAETAFDGIFAATFLANVHFNLVAIDYFTSGLPQPVLQHYWSLAIEEQFYLIWPVIFFLARGQRRRALTVSLIATTSFLYALYAVSENSTSAYFSMLARVWELAVGVLLALFNIEKPQKYLGYGALFALIALSMVFTQDAHFPGLPALFVVLLTALILICSQGNRILSSRLMKWIGDRSYTLYLLHWPIVHIATLSKGSELTVSERSLLLSLLIIAATIIFGFFENPIRHSTLFSKKPTVTVVWGLTLIFLVTIGLTLIRSSI